MHTVLQIIAHISVKVLFGISCLYATSYPVHEYPCMHEQTECSEYYHGTYRECESSRDEVCECLSMLANVTLPQVSY